MKTISRAITMSLSAGIFVTLFVSNAFASCGDLNLRGPFEFPEHAAGARILAAAATEKASDDSPTTASIVGLWKVQLISKGNTSHNPSIPDGALLDFGFTQWHSDGTEIQNSAGVPGGGFCLGTWVQTGFLGFELNHFPIAFDPTTGKVANYINLREQVTLSPDGTFYVGTFTENIYDPTGQQVDHLAGTTQGERITVDSSYPSALPTN
jgi:predicted small lipoprotein YifL